MIVIAHGGAAKVSTNFVDLKLKGIKNAVKSGFEALISGKSAIDSVEATVISMENEPVFNAGLNHCLLLYLINFDFIFHSFKFFCRKKTSNF
jgi:beta-aspartyl-peptidase (threonine type)